MATFHLNSCKLWVAQYELGKWRQGRLSHSVEEIDTTTFGASFRSRIGGLEDTTLEVGGFFDADGADEPDDILWSQLAQTGGYVTVAPTDGTEGEKGYSFEALHLDYTPLEGGPGDAAGFSVSASGRGRLVRGTILEDGVSAITASADGTGYQLGTVATGQKVYGFLHVLAASGTTPTLDVVVESDDNASFTSAVTRLTFTQATAATSEVQTAAGPITDDYWRASFTVGGTTPSFTAVLLVGIR